MYVSDNTEMDKDTAFGGKPPLPKKKTPISGKRLKTQSGGSVYDGNLAGDRGAVVLYTWKVSVGCNFRDFLSRQPQGISRQFFLGT